MLLLAGAVALCAADEPKAAALPRYRFQIGQELVFDSSSSFKYGEGDRAGSLDTHSVWTVWVVRSNADGSHRLVLRQRTTTSQSIGGKKYDRPPQTQIVYADVFPDGRVLPNATIQYRGHPGSVFPPLPRDAAEAKAGWQAQHGDERTLCKRLPDGAFRFEAASESPTNKIYLSSKTFTYTFDDARGLIAHADGVNTQGYGFKGAGTGRIELKTVKTADPEALRSFAETADRYFAAVKTYEDLLRAARSAAPAEGKELLAKAHAAVTAAAEQMGQEDFRAALADSVKRHEQMAKYYLDEAERRAKIVGQPAAEFDTVDIDGAPARLADLRGKVVVLDFWYRGCGWCIKAMPQLNQLTADFSGQPVAILGMNIDQKEEDARFVIDKMQLKYPTLKATGLPEKFGVRGYPTLVIVDPQGNIHDLHVGYTPTLREELGAVIRKLLAAK
jgi:peroxiredoxin